MIEYQLYQPGRLKKVRITVEDMSMLQKQKWPKIYFFSHLFLSDVCACLPFLKFIWIFELCGPLQLGS